MAKAYKNSHFFFAVALIFFLTIFLFFILGTVVPVSFNQLEIESLDIRHGNASWGQWWGFFFSRLDLGLRFFLGGQVGPPNKDDPEEVAAYIFSWIPSYARVYPTEGYYYFQTQTKTGPITGNIRVAELPEKISLFYFDTPKENRHTFGLVLDKNKITIERSKDPSSFQITFRSYKRVFALMGDWNRLPTKPALEDGEELVGRIFDESGIRFILIYNHPLKKFYCLIDDELAFNDFVESDGSLRLSKRTGFVFAEDSITNRKILVGVYFPNTQVNNFFDGPSDQVPFQAPLKKFLSLQSPEKNLQIDDGGILLDKNRWARIAISPYLLYGSWEELESRMGECEGYSGPELWSCWGNGLA